MSGSILAMLRALAAMIVCTLYWTNAGAQVPPLPNRPPNSVSLLAAHWEGWENLGGLIHAETDCVSNNPNSIDCFGIGPNGSLARRTFNGSWGASQYPGIVIGSYGSVDKNDLILPAGPDCLSYAPGRIDCFAIGGDNALYHRWWDGGSEGWWENLEGVSTAQPTCVAMQPRHFDCFIRDPAGNMQWRWWDGNIWYNTWTNGNLGGTISPQTRPACVAWHNGPGPGRIDCVINFQTSAPPGNDLRVKSLVPQATTTGGNTITNWTWTGWSPLPMNGGSLPATLQPKCVANGGVLVCIAWAFQPDSTLKMMRWTFGPQGWTMSDLGNDSGDAASAARYGRRTWNDFDCVARGTDVIDCMELVGRSTQSATSPNGLYDTSVHLRHASWRASAPPTAQVSWSTFDYPVKQPFGTSHLRCVSRAADRIDCFASSATIYSGGPLMHAWYVPPPTQLNGSVPHVP